MFLKLHRWFGLASLNPSMSVDKLWDFTWSAWNMYACIKYIYWFLQCCNEMCEAKKWCRRAADFSFQTWANTDFCLFGICRFLLGFLSLASFHLFHVLSSPDSSRASFHSFTQSSHPITSLEAFHLFHLTNNSHNNIGKPLTYVN